MSILIKPNNRTAVYQSITPKSADWDWLNFEARLMKKREQWIFSTGQNEMTIVLLGGNFKVESDRGNWETKNGRKDVFSGVAHTLYLSRDTSFTLTAQSKILDIAYGWCKADKDFEPKFLEPEDTPTVILEVIMQQGNSTTLCLLGLDVLE